MELNEKMQRLKQLEDENRRLKQIAAEQTLDNRRESPWARTHSGQKSDQRHSDCKSWTFNDLRLEAPPGFEPGMEVLQIWRGSLSC